MQTGNLAKMVNLPDVLGSASMTERAHPKMDWPVIKAKLVSCCTQGPTLLPGGTAGCPGDLPIWPSCLPTFTDSTIAGYNGRICQVSNSL